jgi:hypothetical protein
MLEWSNNNKLIQELICAFCWVYFPSNSVSYSVTCNLIIKEGIFSLISETNFKNVVTFAAYCEKLLMINNLIISWRPLKTLYSSDRFNDNHNSNLPTCCYKVSLLPLQPLLCLLEQICVWRPWRWNPLPSYRAKPFAWSLPFLLP